MGSTRTFVSISYFCRDITTYRGLGHVMLFSSFHFPTMRNTLLYILFTSFHLNNGRAESKWLEMRGGSRTRVKNTSFCVPVSGRLRKIFIQFRDSNVTLQTGSKRFNLISSHFYIFLEEFRCLQCTFVHTMRAIVCACNQTSINYECRNFFVHFRASRVQIKTKN